MTAESKGSELHQMAPDLWTLDGEPISFFSFPYALRMTIIRLADGSLFLHSPVQLSDTRRVMVDSVGEVRFIVSPNKIHNLYLGHWASAYPDAKLYAPPGLRKRRSDLEFDGELTDTAEPAWESDLRQCVVRGSVFMEEVLFFHIASSTLIVGDLIENHDARRFSRWQRVVGRLNRMLAPNGETPVNYRLSFTNRKRARSCLERVLSWQPRQVVVMHGPCILEDADAFLKRGFAWALTA